MMPDPKLNDEAARLAALNRYDILDTLPEGPFDKITALVRTVLGVPISAVSLVDADRQWFKSQQGLDARETGRDVSFCAHTIQARLPMIVPDTSADTRFRHNALVVGPPHIGSYAGVPLETPDGYNIGALCAIDTVPRIFAPNHIEVMRNLGGLVVEELELRRIASQDHLTGALTRRGFVAELEKEIARFQRHGRPSALVMFDIDHFKAVNDMHGHAAGDRVLRAIAECCEATMRRGETFGRLGGEEFGLLLPEAGLAEALTAAERFRAAFASLRIHCGTILSVTASFGVAALDETCADSELWLARADNGLYAAKRSGRNRCEAVLH